MSMDLAQQHQTYDPAAFFYKVRNDRSLEDGPLATVLARVADWNVYDPVLAHYLAYCCSLTCDSLTTPVYAVSERLRWTPQVEYTERDGIGLLMFHIEGNVVLVFRSTAPFDETMRSLSSTRQSTDSRLPTRVALAEQHHMALKHNPTTPLQRLPRPEDEQLFTVAGGKIEVISSISNRYQSRASEARSFVEEYLGAPIPVLDAVRLMLADRASKRQADHGVTVSAPPEFDGLTHYHTARPHIIITGHGVGGALAQLCALDMAALYGQGMVCTYTFGQCRLGNLAFAKLFNRLGGRLFRVVNSFDPVAKLPRKVLGFCHPSGSRIRYSYPPALGREFIMNGTQPPSKRERLSLLKVRGRGLFWGETVEIRLHSAYCGILIPGRLTAMEPFPFVVHRLVDDEPPQPHVTRGVHPPPRAELDMHQAASLLPWELILRDLAPSERVAMRHRLEVYSGSRQSPWSTYATPSNEQEQQQQQQYQQYQYQQSGMRQDGLEEPLDYRGPGEHMAAPLEPLPAGAVMPEQKTGQHVRFVPGGSAGIGAE